MRRYLMAILFCTIIINCSFAQKTSWKIQKLSENVFRIQGDFAMELCNIGCSLCFGASDSPYRIYRYLIPLNDVLKQNFSYDTVFFFEKNLRASDSISISKYKLDKLLLDSVYFELNQASIITVFAPYMKRQENKTF